MIGEKSPVSYEGTLLDQEIQIFEPLDTEKIAFVAGKLATTAVLMPHAVLMPEGELLALEAAIAAVNAADAVKFRENADNN
jgi:hypothetical protein